jgi:hypothetical protein
MDASLFAIPDGMDMAFDATLAERGDVKHQYLQMFEAIGFPLDGRQLSINATEVVGPGIFFLTGGSHNSMAVIQDEGVVIVDGVLDETRTGAILTWLERVAPGMPVTHVIQSHHHVDHSGGRSLAGTTGATVVAGEGAVEFHQDEAFGAVSEVVPDGIDGSGIPIVGVGDEPYVIESAKNPSRCTPSRIPMRRTTSSWRRTGHCGSWTSTTRVSASALPRRSCSISSRARTWRSSSCSEGMAAPNPGPT